MPAVAPTPTDEYLTFSTWFAGVVARWRMIAWIGLFAMLIALASTFIIPPVYRSHASFVANASSPNKLQGAASGSPIGGIISQMGGSLGGDPSESPNFYLQLLLSRELLTRLLESEFPDPRTSARGDSARLIDILKIRAKDPGRRMELGVKMMIKKIEGGLDPKTNLVWFSADAPYSELSSQISNRLITLVGAFNRETRVTRAKSKRLFLERRLDSARAALNQSEERLRFFYEQNRGLLVAPALKFEEARLKREQEVNSDMFLGLQGQLETARIDEVNDAALITVIDTAVAPRRPEWPHYGAVTVTGLALGLTAGFLLAGSLAVFAFWRERHPEEWAALARTWESELFRLPRRLRGKPPRGPGISSVQRDHISSEPAA
ncbi:MAG TPA: GNVR domain-containing protein [Gemmatimonadaceae bacterium]